MWLHIVKLFFAALPACVLLFVLESPEILIVGNWANGWDLLIEFVDCFQ